jgi:hypothetical protein
MAHLVGANALLVVTVRAAELLTFHHAFYASGIVGAVFRLAFILYGLAASFFSVELGTSRGAFPHRYGPLLLARLQGVSHGGSRSQHDTHNGGNHRSEQKPSLHWNLPREIVYGSVSLRHVVRFSGGTRALSDRFIAEHEPISSLQSTSILGPSPSMPEFLTPTTELEAVNAILAWVDDRGQDSNLG